MYPETGGWRWEASRGDGRETVPRPQAAFREINFWELQTLLQRGSGTVIALPQESLKLDQAALQKSCCWEQFSVAFQRVAVTWPGGPLSSAMLGASSEQKETEWQASRQASLSLDAPPQPPTQGLSGHPQRCEQRVECDLRKRYFWKMVVK